MSNSLYESSFQGIYDLYGGDCFQRLQGLHVTVMGIGGVGSWIAESLARSGVGKITLIDLDDICFSNINRQIHSLPSTAGKMKVDVMKERILSIHPGCEVETKEEFFSSKNAEEVLNNGSDFYVDAFDNFEEKVLLIKACLENNKKVVCLGSVGGKIDPSKIRVSDLSQSSNDRLLFRVRKVLRREHAIATDSHMGVMSVYSTERARFLNEQGEVCFEPENPRQHFSTQLNCYNGLGSASYVTGTFAFMATSLMINSYLSK